MAIARGTFDVTMVPTEGPAAEGADVVTRFVLDKTYSGDLIGTGRGQMLASTTGTEGSAGYVAIEEIRGVLGGTDGGFVVQHFGIMDRGAATLQVPIIPDSGGGGLLGIRGELTIDVDDGTHTYTLTYALN